MLFPTNIGTAGGTLQVYQVDPATGARRSATPAASWSLDATGAFGPFTGQRGASYEFALVRNGAPTHHFYFQPFVRSDRLVRLLAGIPGEGLGANLESSPNHVNVTLSRYREWWGDQGTASDVLTVNGTSVLNAANAPRSKRVIGIFLTDAGKDQVTNLAAPISAFYNTVFMTGMDVFLSAGPAPAKVTVTVTVTPRGAGGSGRTDTVNVAAWPSDQHRVSVQLNDYS